MSLGLSSRRILGYYRLVSEAEKLATVVGRQAKKIRVDAGWTLEDIARWARRRGLKWSTARVVEFENGKIPLTLGTLLIVCEALSGTKTPIDTRTVKLSDLIPESGVVQLNADFSTDAALVKGILAGQDVQLYGTAEVDELLEEQTKALSMVNAAMDLAPKNSNRLMLRIEHQHGLAEKRLAKSLGLSSVELVACEASLWGQSMSAERAQRADEDATPQKLGRITRELKSEIQDYLKSKRGSLSGDD